MASQITNYQCPACTGPLHFEGSTGKLQCDYCGSVFEVAEIEALYAEKDAQAAENAQANAEQSAQQAQEDWTVEADSDWGADAENMRAYTCPSCGAELICDVNTAATSCPYCGNPTIVPASFAGTLRPDYVIPFKISREEAVATLKKFYRGKKLLPKNFTDNNHIEEIKGVYVPFWLYDGTVSADMSFTGTRIRTQTMGNERITITEYYDVRRAGEVDFRGIPVDAATKMPDEHMDALEPFDYSEIKPFSTAYMPGFFADKYDVSEDDSRQRANERAVNTACSVIQSTVTGYAGVMPGGRNVWIRNGKAKYAFLPVWVLNTQWNGKNFLFSVNGQTGKLAGDLPVDKGKMAAWFAGIAVPLMALMYFLLML